MTRGGVPVVPEPVAPGVLRLRTGRLLGEANVYLIGSGVARAGTEAGRSVARLAELEPTVIAPGHGRPLTGAGTARALGDLAQRLRG